MPSLGQLLMVMGRELVLFVDREEGDGGIVIFVSIL